MGKEVVLFASEEHVNAKHVSDFLRQLADKVDTGEVTLSKGSESLTLNLPQNLVLEVKAEAEDKNMGTKRSLEVEIEWMEGEDVGQLTLE